MNNIKLNDLGYAVLIHMNYDFDKPENVKDAFSFLHNEMMSSGFNFDNRIFFRLGSKENVLSDVMRSVTKTLSISNFSFNELIKSIHLIPLTEFSDITLLIRNNSSPLAGGPGLYYTGTKT